MYPMEVGMSQYFRTNEMVKTGKFRCYNCNKALARKISGSVFILVMECNRCHSVITVKCNEPIPILEEEFVKGINNDA